MSEQPTPSVRAPTLFNKKLVPGHGLFNARKIRAYVAEFVGMFFFLFTSIAVVCGSTAQDDAKQTVVLNIAWTFGMTIMIMAYSLGKYSGGHFNPAVTLGLAIFPGNISWGAALIYIISQCLGAMSGAAMVSVLFPESMTEISEFGLNKINPNFSFGQAVGLEILGTMLLVFVVYGTAVDPRRDTAMSHMAAIPIGFTVFLAHVLLVPLTGCGINPARSLASAVVSGNFKDHGVFWLGPMVGGIIGASLHHIPFQWSCGSEDEGAIGVFEEEHLLRQETIDRESKETRDRGGSIVALAALADVKKQSISLGQNLQPEKI